MIPAHRLAGQAALLAALVAVPPSWAEPVGGPSGLLKKGRWVMGLSGGALPERTFAGSADGRVYGGGHFRGFGLTDWLSVYGKIGGAWLEADDASIVKSNSTSTLNRFGANVLSSGQVRVKLWRSPQQRWAWDGSIQYVDMRARHRDKNEARWHEWQFATSVSRSFGRVTPYAGLKASLLDFSYRVRENGALLSQGGYDGETPLGAFLGSDIILGEDRNVVVTVEGGYLDGFDLALMLSYFIEPE